LAWEQFASEDYLSLELEEARIARQGDSAEGWRIDLRVRIVELRVIEQIERIAAQPQRNLLGERE
jgi:hypothetical protein